MDRTSNRNHPQEQQQQQQPKPASAAMIDAGMPPQDVETSTSPSADTSRLIISTLAKATVQTESYATAATTADIDVADTTSTNEEIPGDRKSTRLNSSHAT